MVCDNTFSFLVDESLWSVTLLHPKSSHPRKSWGCSLREPTNKPNEKVKVLYNDHLRHSSKKLQKSMRECSCSWVGKILRKITILQSTVHRFNAFLVLLDLKSVFHPLAMSLCSHLPGRQCFMYKAVAVILVVNPSSYFFFLMVSWNHFSLISVALLVAALVGG